MIYYIVLLTSGFLVQHIASELYDVKSGWRGSLLWTSCEGKTTCPIEDNKFSIDVEFRCKWGMSRYKTVIATVKYKGTTGAYYEFENVGTKTVGDLKSMCSSIFHDKHRTGIIHFHNKGVWWCDVFENMQFRDFCRFDKCDVVEEEQRWLDGGLSVSIQRSTYSEDEKCKDKKTYDMVCNLNGVVFRADYYCSNNNPPVLVFSPSYRLLKMAMKGFRVSYKKEPSEDEMKTYCSLFQVKFDEQYIDLQYFQRGNWRCLSYKKKENKKTNIGNTQYNNNVEDIWSEFKCYKWSDYTDILPWQ